MNQTTHWFSYTRDDIKKQLSTDFEKGLDDEAVSKLQAQYGKNTFKGRRRYQAWRSLLKQLKNPLVVILLVAGLVTFVLGEYIDTTVIFIALLITIGIDIFQEGSTDKSFEKLRESQQKFAFVLRDGKKSKIPAAELVPGDIIFVEAGNLIPADARLLEQTELLINESALTGEWIDVTKDAEKEVIKGPITQQTNMVWMGTLVSSGTGKAVVVATGAQTQLGIIAESLLEVVDSPTPLQRSIKKLARFLAVAVMVVIVLLILLGVIKGESVGDMLLIAVAIAVAATPSGLPAAVTVVLAIGMEKILKRDGLVRNLLAAETLGSTTIILTDKTGTLTEAKMKVVSVVTTSTAGSEQSSAQPSFAITDKDERTTLAMATMVSDAFVEWKQGEQGAFQVHGRPVERAIVAAGLEAGLHQDVLLQLEPQLDFVPFESARKVSASLHEVSEDVSRMIIVGAPELVVGKASKFLIDEKEKKITKQVKDDLRAFQESQSSQGARLIGVGYKKVSEDEFHTETGDGAEALGENFVFAGFIILDDPIREGVKEAIKTAQGSGIRVIMATGDHPSTGARIATEVGIKRKNGRVLTGDEVEALSDKELLAAFAATDVFARVLPHQKLRIAKLLKGQGEIVAMTGDGINDAPALRSADIGIALGSGTDVAKEASDLILLDNGFDIIVAAVEEGRRIVDNLKKITSYLLSTGFSEILVVGGAIVLGAPLPLLPAQILWINIIEEGFMNFAFAFEPKEKGIMKRNPRATGSTILTPRLIQLISLIAFITGTFLVVLYFILLKTDMSIEQIRTIMFIALSVDSIFFTFSLKDLHNPIWKISLFSNRYLIGALSLSLLILLVALSWTPLQTLLSLEPFSLGAFGLIALFGVVNLLIIEVVKHAIFTKKLIVNS